MDDPLDGFKAKLRRAGEHLRTLDALVEEFLTEQEPYRVSIDRGVGPGMYRIRVSVNAEVPSIEWGLVIGDCVHNLRSALDHLAWELAGPEPPPKTEFPIFKDAEKFDSTGPGGGRFKIRGIKRAEAIAFIERAQPHRAQYPETHGLWMLQELSNWDKHKTLHLTGAVINGAGYWEGPGADDFVDNLNFGAFEDGAVVSEFWMPPFLPTPEVDMDFKLEFDVAFGEEGPGRGWLVTGAIRRIMDYVRVDVARPAVKLYER